MKRIVTWFWAAAALVALSSSCDGNQETTTEKVCEPGTEVFCRPCPGNVNETGTKTCNAAGSGFEQCVPRSGECEVVGCSPGETLFCSCSGGGAGEKICNDEGTGYTACECTAAGGSGGSGAGNGGGGSAGGAGGATGTKPLLSPCIKNSECQSNFCPMGYCTKECQKISDCPFGSAECVSFQSVAFCMPLCNEQSACDVYGVPSECGYAHAIDDFPVTTCADWLNALDLPPDGSACAGDVDCNLGHDGEERVCAFEACTQGCYESKDCPTNKECSSTGNLGSCQ